MKEHEEWTRLGGRVIKWGTRAIRAFVGDDHKPYFIGIDVARALDYSKPSSAVARHCKEPKKLRVLHSQFEGYAESLNMNAIGEEDLYRLFMESTTPKGEEFRDWITGTIIPVLRRTEAIIPVEDVPKEEALAEVKALVVALERRLEQLESASLSARVDLLDFDTLVPMLEAESAEGVRHTLLRKTTLPFYCVTEDAVKKAAVIYVLNDLFLCAQTRGIPFFRRRRKSTLAKLADSLYDDVQYLAINVCMLQARHE
jgi:prophage antirepressor-like protein